MKRPWFQIHLSTAIVMMLVAGGLIWVNLFESRLPLDNDGGGSLVYQRGWPCIMCRGNEYWVARMVWNYDVEVWAKPGERGGTIPPFTGFQGEWSFLAITFNLCVIAGIEFIVVIMIETLIRRRQRV